MTEAGEQWADRQRDEYPLEWDNDQTFTQEAEFWLRAFVAEVEKRTKAKVAERITPEWDEEDVLLLAGSDLWRDAFNELKRELLGEKCSSTVA